MTLMPLLTLHNVSISVHDGKPFNFAIKEFLDVFIASPSKEALAAEPTEIKDDVERVYIAGVAEYLSHYLGEKPPEWSDGDNYFLAKPVVYGANKSKAQYISETPSAFRRRLLFCGATLTKLYSYK